jgi:hypothetical protein
VTTAPERPKAKKPRAGRRAFDPGPLTFGEWWHTIADLCGACAGNREVWCPRCEGFEGCWFCKGRFKGRCPECAGGRE